MSASESGAAARMDKGKGRQSEEEEGSFAGAHAGEELVADTTIGGSALSETTAVRTAPVRVTVEIPDLELPEPAIPTPAPVVTASAIAAAARRSLGLFSSPRNGVGSPRTRFDLTASPMTGPVLSPLVTGQPLKPILNPPSTPHHRAIEYDITDQRRTSPPASPFPHPDNDEAHPIRRRGHRTPHPMYTPALPRRTRRRRKARSVASGRTSHSGKSARSFVRNTWRFVKRSGRRFDTRSSINGGHSSGSSSTSTSRSGSSNSTWNGWRFWRGSSSGSSSSQGSQDTEEEWEAPTPHFTLLTPYISRSPLSTSYPSHLRPGAPSASIVGVEGVEGARGERETKPVFDLVTTTTIAPAIERLQTFWSDRVQEDGITGDLGEKPLAGEQDDYFFPHANPDFTATPAVTPGVTPGIAPGRRLRGEEKAAKAEKRRAHNRDSDEKQGPAWWLDVMCPTVADLRELRKILPLHPLTMEDIIHQETREKIETFPSLGYYFIVFRALDESYFKYTGGNGGEGREGGAKDGRKARVDIVEGVGGKEGVEGVGVGAVNIYLVVFRDGILSFHFEDISKHVERVQGKLQQYGATRSMSADWIAYGLMDSVVDAFCPLIDYIEGESNEVDNFLADPVNAIGHSPAPATIKGGTGGSGTATPVLVAEVVRGYEGDISGISPARSSESTKDLKDQESSSAQSTDKPGRGRRLHEKFRMATIRRRSMASVLSAVPIISVTPLLSKILPRSWTKAAPHLDSSTMLVDASSFQIKASILPFEDDFATALLSNSTTPLINPEVDRVVMLKRIADMRKLVTGLSRLMGPKADVVRGLRKRTQAEGEREVRDGDASHDISLYIGDLLDHSIAMQQSLNFYDAILSHDHLAYLGILRLSLAKAKGGIDYALVKLYIVTLTILPINILVGLFSLNVQEPCNGARGTHLNDDGTLAGFSGFYFILGGAVLISFGVWTFVWFVFRSSHASAKRKKIQAKGLGAAELVEKL